MTVTLYQGDCLEILRGMDTGSVDAIVTDPPYGIEACKAGAHSSIRDNPRWPIAEWDNQRPPAEVFSECIRVSRMAAIWGGNYFSDLLPISSGWLVWRKPEAERGFSLADGELCWTNRTGAVRIKTHVRRDGNQHPTQKPVAIMTWTLACLGVPVGATVLDPFMGSGSTGVACVQTGRSFIGIEIDPTYYAIAEQRIAEAQMQLPLPLDAAYTQMEAFA